MTPYNGIQKREIFHFRFLEELLKISDPRLYVLKGGVNLRFFFKSPRFSQDMDLDVSAGNVATLKKNGYKIFEAPAFKRSLQTYGITELVVNDPLKAKQTETTQRFRLRLITEAGESLPTLIEFSRRHKDKSPFLLERVDPEIARAYQRLSFQCQHYTGESAAIQKVQALAGRQVPQARDVFDLMVLYDGGYFKSAHVKGLDRETIQKAAEILSSIKYEDFQGQVIEFLDEPVRTRYESRKAWGNIKNTVLGELVDE